jgi:hypothetical protein
MGANFNPHPALSLSKGEGFLETLLLTRTETQKSLSPSKRKGRLSSRDAADEPQAWQFELKGEALRRGLRESAASRGLRKSRVGGEGSRRLGQEARRAREMADEPGHDALEQRAQLGVEVRGER